jgi:hypothetical protein
MLKLTKPVSSARIFKGEQSAFVAGGREVARLAEEGKTYTMRVIMCTGGFKVMIVPPRGLGGLPYYLER